jgi:hypothetical protein
MYTDCLSFGCGVSLLPTNLCVASPSCFGSSAGSSPSHTTAAVFQVSHHSFTSTEWQTCPFRGSLHHDQREWANFFLPILQAWTKHINVERVPRLDIGQSYENTRYSHSTFKRRLFYVYRQVLRRSLENHDTNITQSSSLKTLSNCWILPQMVWAGQSRLDYFSPFPTHPESCSYHHGTKVQVFSRTIIFHILEAELLLSS